MTARYYYSSLCPDTPPFAAQLRALGIVHEAADIHASMKNLKDFIALRESHPAFADKIGTRTLGVPVLISEDNQAFFTPEALAKHFAQPLNP